MGPNSDRGGHRGISFRKPRILLRGRGRKQNSRVCMWKRIESSRGNAQQMEIQKVGVNRDARGRRESQATGNRHVTTVSTIRSVQTEKDRSGDPFRSSRGDSGDEAVRKTGFEPMAQFLWKRLDSSY